MPTETQEHSTTVHHLTTISNWLKPGTNEGASFEITRLTDDLFTSSFLGGGDCSLFTPSGARGKVKGQECSAYLLDPSAGPPSSFSFDMGFDLNSGKVTLSWTFPGGSPQTASFGVEYSKTVARPEGKNLLFAGEPGSDDAVYTLSVILL